MMIRPRMILIAALAAWLTVPVLAASQTKEFSETVPLEAGGRLSVKGSKGSIQLTSWDREEVEIHARIEASGNGSDDYARRAVEATTVEVSGTRRSVSIRSDYDDVPYRSSFWDDNSRSVPEIHYEIRAPRRLNLLIDSDRGPANVSGFEGEIEIEADRGEVDLSELTGDIRLDLDRGGDSRMSRIRGGFDIEADRTNISMRDVRIDDDSRLEIDRGDVEIDLDVSQGLTLRANMSRRSEFESDFPITMESLDNRDFRGTINGGGPELRIDSDRGSVRLRER